MPLLQSTAFFCFLTLSLTLSLAGCSNSANPPAGSTNAAAQAATPLIDTTKLKSDLSDVLNSISSGKPDTAKLKAAASDILSTDAKVLSDSGIDQLYGNSNDPAVKAAANTLKKMRNAAGLTPDKLDSIKAAAAALHAN